MPADVSMYEFCCKVRGVKIRTACRNSALKIDAKTVTGAIGRKTKLIFIDSPGNPAGTLVDKNSLITILRQKVVVVVDEAYFEYCGKTAAPLVKQYPNLIILRSFSKWAGLSGLRLGYLIANPKIIKNFLLIKPPYNVNSAAQELGLIALSRRKLLLKKLKQQLTVKRQIVEQLKRFKNFEVLSGQGFYILVRVKNFPRDELLGKLKAKGILVKPLGQAGLQDSFLVSLESVGKMKKLIKSLELIFKE